MIYIDTDKLSDKCSQCKARAGIETKSENKEIFYRVRCTECCETGEWISGNFAKYFAIFKWNIQQRKNK